MRCHYEILEVARDADAETIKKAYRNLALKWHPDKNPDKIEECTKYFALIQQAYDVLGDARERAWYDRHRESILKGGIDDHYHDDSLNLFPYFTSACFSSFNDDEKGFYAVYRKVFETIAAEDYPFLEDPLTKYPTFGDSKSNYEEVVGPFYCFWQSFSTARSFSWLDKYDIRDAQNRQVLRAMEKENKKLREAGRKERNEEIRELVSYVRKRDKRVQLHKKVLEERRVEQEKKTEENRRRRIQQQLEELGEYKESEETRLTHLEDLREIEEALAAEFGEEEIYDKNDAVDQSLYCICCEKAFKTERAMKNHEKSKKHKEAVEELKKHMQEEDALLLENDAEIDENAVGSSAEPSAEPPRRKMKQRRKQRKTRGFDTLDGDAGDDDGESAVASSLQSAKTSEVNGTTFSDAVKKEEGNVLSDAEREAEKTARKEIKRKEKRVENLANHGLHELGPRSGTCDRCGEVFESRTKLFKHLKESGHATLKVPPLIPKIKGTKKGKK